MKIGIIGVGHMGTAIIKGLSKNPKNIIIAENHPNQRVKKLAQDLGFTFTTSISEFIEKDLDIIILTTPIGVTLEVAKQLKNLPNKAIILSAAAGIKYVDLKKVFPNNPVSRIIPNIPVAINAGTIGLFNPTENTTQINELIKKFLEQLGDVIETTEDNLSIIGTIGGCGPAFVDVFLEALATSGILNGLPSNVAEKVAASMVKGSATLAYQTQTPPAILRNQVCSPGGTTIKGVASLEKNNFRYAVIDAMNKSNQN